MQETKNPQKDNRTRKRNDGRRQTRQILVRGLPLGGGAPVSVQSMLTVPAERTEEALAQIRSLQEAGCDIVRLAIPTKEAAQGLSRIRSYTDMPLVADVHFDYRLALDAVAAGADKIRINPGNIGDDRRVQAVAEACLKRQIPIRVGVNAGSLEEDLLERYGGPTAEALAESALRNAARLEAMGVQDMVLSLKSSNVITTVAAYRMVAARSEYPLHIGVTEAGTHTEGVIRSAVGIGALLLDGIGDTLRVSLTDDPAEEVRAGKRILAACGLYQPPIRLVSCPTCGRTQVDLMAIAGRVEQAMDPVGRNRQQAGKPPLTVAVMGCVVNGPGEAKEADLGVAGGKGQGLLFRRGKPLCTVAEEDIVKELVRLATDYEDI